MKDIKNDTNRWRDILCSWAGKINIVKSSFMKQLIKLINFWPGKIGGKKGHKLPISGMREVPSIQIL